MTGIQRQPRRELRSDSSDVESLRDNLNDILRDSGNSSAADPKRLQRYLVLPSDGSVLVESPGFVVGGLVVLRVDNLTDTTAVQTAACVALGAKVEGGGFNLTSLTGLVAGKLVQVLVELVEETAVTP